MCAHTASCSVHHACASRAVQGLKQYNKVLAVELLFAM
jgi:hypothetical protein